MHSDVHFCLSSLSFLVSSASLSFVVARRGLSFAHFCFSRCRLAIQSFTSPSCRLCRLLSRFVVLSSASRSFTSAPRCQRRPATRLLQLLIANVGLVVVLRVPQESYKSGYRPARYLTNFLLLCTEVVTCPSEKLLLKIRTRGCNKKKPVETTATNNYVETTSTEVKLCLKRADFFE